MDQLSNSEDMQLSCRHFEFLHIGLPIRQGLCSHCDSPEIVLGWGGRKLYQFLPRT